MYVGPEGRKQDQFSPFGFDEDVLEVKFRLSARPVDVIQVPDCYQLSLPEFTGPAIHMPLVEFLWQGSGRRVARR